MTITNRKLVANLLKWIADLWRRIVHQRKTEEVTFPPLSEFVKFLSREAGIACDPVVSVHSLREDDIKKTDERDKCNRFTPMPREGKRLIGSNFLVAGTKNPWNASQQAREQEPATMLCHLCKGRHDLDKCECFLNQRLL